MNFTPKYEIDKWPVVRWFANIGMSISGWLMRLCLPYALVYEADFDDEGLLEDK
jgi:hypothetical protein